MLTVFTNVSMVYLVAAITALEAKGERCTAIRHKAAFVSYNNGEVYKISKHSD